MTPESDTPKLSEPVKRAPLSIRRAAIKNPKAVILLTRIEAMGRGLTLTISPLEQRLLEKYDQGPRILHWEELSLRDS